MARIIVVFLLFWSGVVLASAQPTSEEDPQDNHRPAQQKVITDAAEYNAYITALNIWEPAARQAAFESFLEQFPNSIMRDEAVDSAMDALIQLDNQRTAAVRLQLRWSHKVEPTPEERACKLAREKPPETMSFEDWAFILQYRDSGAACNRDGAEKVWRDLLARQKGGQRDPGWVQFHQIRVLAITDKYIDAAITEDNQKAGRADLRAILTKPLAQPPARGSTVNVKGTISDYSTRPFMFIMTGAELVVVKRPATVVPDQEKRQSPYALRRSR